MAPSRAGAQFSGMGGSKLLDQVRHAARVRQFSPHVGWVRRFVRARRLRHPAELGADDVAAFLTMLAVEGGVSAATQRQAARALLFLYREVLGLEIELPPGITRPARPKRLPTVISRDEVRRVLAEMQGAKRLVAELLYGSGLRLLEALQLRVKDIARDRHEIMVRSGKGGHDRVALLPVSLRSDLERQLGNVRRLHAADVRHGAGWVALPGALDRKMPGAARQLSWQYLSPASRLHADAATGQRRRHHLHESAVQRAVAHAVRAAGVTSRATCHTRGKISFDRQAIEVRSFELTRFLKSG